MAKVHFLLKEPQHGIEPSKMKESLILFVMRLVGSKKVVYSIREYILPSQWDFKLQSPKVIRNRADLAELRIKLADIERHFMAFTRMLENRSMDITHEVIVAELDAYFGKVAEGDISVIKTYALGVYMRGKNTDSVKITRSFVGSLNKYKPNITFDMIDNALIRGYHSYLIQKKYKRNTISVYLDNFYTIVAHAVNKSGIKASKDALKLLSDAKISKEKVKRAVLSVDELVKLYQLDVQDPVQKQVRDVFIIMAFTGIRRLDARQSENVHFGDSRFFAKRTSKTGAFVKIPLHPIVRELLEQNKGFKFPDINDHDFNTTIRELVKQAGITSDFSYSITIGGIKTEFVKKKYECISAHSARRSFATNIHKAGIPPAVAMVFTGHKTIQQYMDYIMVYEDETAEEYANHPFFTSINVK